MTETLFDPDSRYFKKTTASPFQMKDMDNEGWISGYANVFGVVDQQKDMVIAESVNAKDMDDVKLLWQHDTGQPIGTIHKMYSDTKGIYMEAKLVLGTRRGLEAYNLLKAGAIDGLSIGYTPIKTKMDKKTGVRLITEMKLWEVSLVTFPANTESQITEVKQIRDQNMQLLMDSIDESIFKIRGKKKW